MIAIKLFVNITKKFIKVDNDDDDSEDKDQD